MTIAILGTGSVGATLGKGWAQAGHQVHFGTRRPDSEEVTKILTDAGSNAKAMSAAGAVQASDVIVCALPWPATEAALKALGDVGGKVLLDCTNPSKEWPKMDHDAGSGGEQVASWIPSARVVKIFNTTGFGNMADPHYATGPLTMFYAGDDEAANQVAHQLAADLGFAPQYSGPLAMSMSLEHLASLWGMLAFHARLGRDIGFQLVKRQALQRDT